MYTRNFVYDFGLIKIIIFTLESFHLLNIKIRRIQDSFQQILFSLYAAKTWLYLLPDVLNNNYFLLDVYVKE